MALTSGQRAGEVPSVRGDMLFKGQLPLSVVGESSVIWVICK